MTRRMPVSQAPLLGQRIREARKAAGYRNAESFAVAIGVGVRTVQRWEQAAFLPPRKLARIASATQKPLDFFTDVLTAEVAA